MIRPQVENMLTLSTGHIRQATGEALTLGAADGKGGPVACMRWADYGWVVWRDDDLDVEAWPDLAACFALAREHRATWIRFDCDVDPIDGLTSYVW